MDEGGEERKIRVAQKEKVNCSQILKQIWSRVVQSVLQNLGIDVRFTTQVSVYFRSV